MERDGQVQKERLVQLLDAQARGEGYCSSRVSGVRYLRLSRPLSRHQVLYNPCVVIVAQGEKVGYVGDGVYRYDPDNYLVLSIPLPFECETPFATPETPLLALVVDVDPTILGELILDMEAAVPPEERPRGIYTSGMTSEMLDAAVRLLECLSDPVAGPILWRQTVREVLFRVLCGSQGWALRAIAGIDGRFRNIRNALHIIHDNYNHEIAVEDLARAANMSISGFYQAFKVATATSPGQYIKRVRLHKARLLMTHDGMNASTAASAVGYASPSQFSREFKRFFGWNPREEQRRRRA